MTDKRPMPKGPPPALHHVNRQIGPELIQRMTKISEILEENVSLRKELEEEARINGMGGEREARLMAIVAERELEIARLKSAIRMLLDNVNSRYPDKPPREWECEHMAELDRLTTSNEE